MYTYFNYIQWWIFKNVLGGGLVLYYIVFMYVYTRVLYVCIIILYIYMYISVSEEVQTPWTPRKSATDYIIH